VPLLVLRHGTVSPRHVAALRADSRIELLVPEAWTPEVVVLAQRVAATVLVTVGDPLRALGYAVTAGVNGPIVVFGSSRYQSQRQVLLEAGATAWSNLPVRKSGIDAMLAALGPRPRLTHIDSVLRLTLDPISRVVHYRNRTVRLSQREFAVLHYLSTRSGRPVDADELLRVVWGSAGSPARPRQILDVYVCQLRKKLETIGLPGAISTVRRFGYALGNSSAR
jgi:DNA-binding response OmpR family regulator